MTWVAVRAGLALLLLAGFGSALSAFAQAAVTGLNVLNAGARCDGVTDDTAALQRAINQARGSANGVSIVIPQGVPGCVVSQLDLTNAQSQIRIVGGASKNGFQSVIICREPQADAGVCMDFSGTNNFDVEHVRIVGGATPATAPRITVLMGKTRKTSGALGNGSEINWDTVTVIANGDYGIYAYGGEVWTCSNCYFTSTGVADIMLSQANSAAVSSSFASLMPAPVSMTTAHFTGTTFGTGSSATAVLLDPMPTQGAIGDISFTDGYAHLSGPAFIADTGAPGAQSVIEGVRITGMRVEAYSASTAFVSFNSDVLQITIDASYVNPQPDVTPVQFNGAWGLYSVVGGNINLRPGDWNGQYPATVVSCRGTTKGTMIHNFVVVGGRATHNACPAATELF